MRHFKNVMVTVLLAGILAGFWAVIRQQHSASRPPQDATAAIQQVRSVAGKSVLPVTMPQGRPGKAVAGEVLVKIADPQAVRDLGSRLTPIGVANIYKLASDTADPAVATAAAKQLPGVLEASPDYVVAATLTPNDALYATYQWNLPKIAAPAAWNTTTGSSNTIIASLDTGVNWNHQDIFGKNWTNTADQPNNNLDDDGNGYVDDRFGFDFINGTYSGGIWRNSSSGPMDDEGHGSLTASVIAANSNNGVGIAGLNWQARIMPVKVLDTNGFGTLSAIASGIQYAAASGAKVINMSLGAFGISSDFATDAAISSATSQGVVIVAASGNDGSNTTISYPAINSNVIAVGASDGNDNRASYSNAGPQLSVVAPGSGIAGVNAVVNPPNTPSLSVETAASSLAAGTYRYSVSAYNPSGETITSAPPSSSPNADQLTISSGQRSRISWSSVYGATGYKVYRTPVNGAQGTQKMLADVGVATTYTDDGSASLGSQSPPSRTTATMTTAYAIATGTSLAAPHVAGLAGLLLGQNSNLTPAQVRAAMQSSADKVAGMSGQNRTDQYGYGRINAQRALTGSNTYSAQWVGQSVNPTIGSGEQAIVSVDYKNSGTLPWSSGGASPLRLGTSSPRDRASVFSTSSWINPNRAATFSGRVEANGSVTATSTINPGETARFQFTIAAPAGVSGLIREYFTPVVEGITWLEDYGMHWPIQVQAKTYQYAFAGQTYPPAVMQPNQSAPASLDLTNTGTATWRADGLRPLRLGTSLPRDRSSSFASSGWINDSRPATFAGKVVSGNLTASTTVAPGETARFQFTMTAAKSGSFAEYFQPVVENAFWLADIGIHYPVYVPNPSAPSYDYSYAGQSAYPTITRNTTSDLWLRLRNTGSQTWYSNGANPVRLGTARPQDRASGFYTVGSWISPNRIKLSSNLTDPSKNVGGETSIAPGEIGQFDFTATAAPSLGSYPEYFQPVVEGNQWMKDIGIFWMLSVVP